MEIDEHHLVLEEQFFELVTPETLGKKLGLSDPLLHQNSAGFLAEPINVLLLWEPSGGQVACMNEFKQPAMHALCRPAGQCADVLGSQEAVIVDQLENFYVARCEHETRRGRH